MKKSLLLLALVALATTGTTMAQTKMAPVAPGQNPPMQGPGKVKSPEQAADHRAKKMAKELSLNADQEAKLESIFLAERQEMMNAKQTLATSSDRKGTGKALKAGRAKYDEQIKAVLTPEQYTKYSQMKDERKEQRHDARQTGMKTRVKS